MADVKVDDLRKIAKKNATARRRRQAASSNDDRALTGSKSGRDVNGIRAGGRQMPHPKAIITQDSPPSNDCVEVPHISREIGDGGPRDSTSDLGADHQDRIENARNRQVLEYVSHGYSVIPCEPMGNRPLGRLVPHGCKDATTDPETIERWIDECPSANWAIACNGMLVVDVDPGGLDWDGVQRLDDSNCPRQRSQRGGFHYFFRRPEGKDWKNWVSNLSDQVDIRTDGGYIIVQPSIREEGEYRWERPLVPFEDLPYPPEWLVEALDALVSPSPRAEATTASHPTVAGDAVIDRAIKYVAKCPPAISKQGGHNQTFPITAALLHGFMLDEGQTFEILKEHYNPRCVPPWSDAELHHKIESSRENPPDKPRGWLLGIQGNRAADDPDQLALHVLSEYGRDEQGRLILRRWQESFWLWDGRKYVEQTDEAIDNSIRRILNHYFEIINQKEVNKHDSE